MNTTFNHIWTHTARSALTVARSVGVVLPLYTRVVCVADDPKREHSQMARGKA